MTQIEQIRKEIERHRIAIRVLNEHTTPEQTSKTCAVFQYADSILSELNSFLDTLEQPQLPSDVEEAAMEYVRPKLSKDYVEYGERKQMQLTRFDGYDILEAIEFGAEYERGKYEPIKVKPKEAYEYRDVVYALRFEIVDAEMVVPGFDSEFMLYRKKEEEK